MMLSNLQTTVIRNIAHFSTVPMLNNYRHKLTTIYILQVKTITCSPLNPPFISWTSDLKWRMWIQKRDNRRRWGEAESSCATQTPPWEGDVGGVRTHAKVWGGGQPATAQAPLTNRTFLTTSRSLGWHSASIAREEEQRQKKGGREEGKGSGAKVSRQELDKGKKNKWKKHNTNWGVKQFGCGEGYEMEAKDESLVSTGAFLKMKQCCGGTKEEPAEYQLVLKKQNKKTWKIPKLLAERRDRPHWDR